MPTSKASARLEHNPLKVSVEVTSLTAVDTQSHPSEQKVSTE